MAIPVDPDITELVELRDELNKTIEIAKKIKIRFKETQEEIKKLGLTNKQMEGIEKLLFN